MALKKMTDEILKDLRIISQNQFEHAILRQGRNFNQRLLPEKLRQTGIDEQKAPERDPLLDLPGGNERIIFVDDEKILLDLAKQMLVRLGYQITTCSDPLDALEIFRNAINEFDLIMTDMAMPGMTGADLSFEILKLRPDIPIILCTGYSEKIDAEKAREIGIRAFAMKPMTMNEIACIIRKTLDGE